MKEPRVSTNIIFNVLNQLVSIITPLILAPYVARVLSVDLIGDYSVALANSSYFVLAEGLGFGLYGMLKVAANRDDKECVSLLFKEIMIAKLVLMSICILLYVIVFIFVFKSGPILTMIMVLNIFSAGIDTTWFLMGQEDFKTTAYRNILVRVTNVILVLLFIKSKDDFLKYVFIMQFSNAVSVIIVIPQVFRYLTPVEATFKGILKHMKASMIYFIPGLVNTIFTSADKSVLGALAFNSEVGYYEQASKISTLVGGVISSVSNVILPRATYINSKDSQGDHLLISSIRGAMFVTAPLAFGLVAVSDSFVPFFFGPGYERSVVLLKILSINIIFTVLTNFVGHQCLISKGKQRKYNIAILSSAILNLVLNIVVAKKFQSLGVTASSLAAGFLIFAIIMYFSRTEFSIKCLIQISWHYLIAAFGMMFFLIELPNFNSLVMDIFCKIAIGGLVYVFFLVVLRDCLFRSLVYRLVQRNEK